MGQLTSEIVEKLMPSQGKVGRAKQTAVDDERFVNYQAIVANRPSTLAEEVAAVVQAAVDDVRAAGHEVSPEMIEQAKQETGIKNYMDGANMLQQARKVLLREAAVHSALKRAVDDGIQIENCWGRSWGKEGEARFAAVSTGALDYETMFAKASMALNSDNLAYVCSVSTYQRRGLDLILSLSSLGGDALELKVNREVSVAGVAGMVQATVRPVVLGKAREVKLVGPGGTLLPCARAIGDALDHESEDLPLDDKDNVFYP